MSPRPVPAYTRAMLPLLGVTWNRFATRGEALRFARWAERETRNDEYPCDAYVMRDDIHPDGEKWEVKVVNW